MGQWRMSDWQKFLTPFQFDPMSAIQLNSFDVPEFIQRLRTVFLTINMHRFRWKFKICYFLYWMNVRPGLPVWTPNLDSRSGVPTWTPGLDSKLGVPVWIPDLESQSGVPTWSPSLESRSWVQVWTFSLKIEFQFLSELKKYPITAGAGTRSTFYKSTKMWNIFPYRFSLKSFKIKAVLGIAHASFMRFMLNGSKFVYARLRVWGQNPCFEVPQGLFSEFHRGLSFGKSRTDRSTPNVKGVCQITSHGSL